MSGVLRTYPRGTVRPFVVTDNTTGKHLPSDYRIDTGTPLLTPVSYSSLTRTGRLMVTQGVFLTVFRPESWGGERGKFAYEVKYKIFLRLPSPSLLGLSGLSFLISKGPSVKVTFYNVRNYSWIVLFSNF